MWQNNKTLRFHFSNGQSKNVDCQDSAAQAQQKATQEKIGGATEKPYIYGFSNSILHTSSGESM